jgi:AI-2 transport protein TqsA
MLPDGLPEPLGNAGGALGGWAFDQLTSLAKATAAAIGSATAALVLVVFFVLLLLSERANWSRKMRAVFSSSNNETWETILGETASRLRRFLLTRAAIGLLSSALYVVWLAFFGLDLLFVWAILTFILTFIPNIGSVISGVLPTIFAFAMLPFGTAFAVGAGLFVIEQVIGNWIDPRVQGRQIVLSPTVILTSLLLWSWLWGVAGAFLATPIMVALMILFANQPDYESLDRNICD